MRPNSKYPLLLVFLFTVTFYSCEQLGSNVESRQPKGDAVLEGTLSVALAKDVSSLIPARITDAASSEIGLHLHAGLLDLDPTTLEVIPALAESWSIDDNRTSYVFNLRKGEKFHADDCFGTGSREITAHDFEYSFKTLCKTPGETAFESTFGNRVLGADAFRNGETDELQGVVVVDDYTLRILLIKPDPSFLFVLARPSLAVVSAKAEAKYSEASKVGAGPFMYVSNEDEIVLVRNPDFYKVDAFGNRLPYIDTLIFRTIATKQTQLEAFLNGDIDLVSGLYPDPVRDILEKHVADFSGKNPKYIMTRETESVGYESYAIYRAGLTGLGDNFMGYRDFKHVQLRNQQSAH